MKELFEQRVEQLAKWDAIKEGNEDYNHRDQRHRDDLDAESEYRTMAEYGDFERQDQQAQPEIKNPRLRKDQVVDRVAMLSAKEPRYAQHVHTAETEGDHEPAREMHQKRASCLVIH